MIWEYAFMGPSGVESCMASAHSCNTFSQKTQKHYIAENFLLGFFFFCSTWKIDGNLLILKECFPPFLSHFSKDSKEFKLYNISVLHASCVLCLSDASSDFPAAGLSQSYFTPIIFLHDLQSYFQ